ncbi:hypothetical protein F0U60_07615 [Archangium minus]|uniref:Alkyl hydroperoxide reductase subunit C/ Thiol specific antioxidant domain-containing protein n=1 Tax=Archangium minus TaxID=83450 RepID=A0ABY9WJL5_9BACT|nr:hypothetical protein F0U60_07615 [Archangium minus]
MTTWIAGMLTTAVLATSPTLTTEPRVGPMNATLRGSNGKEVALSRWRGKPVILFYEDRHSTTLNAAFKEALFARGQSMGLLDAAWVVAVANLESFNFFPARDIALSYVRDEEKKWGIPILVDLKGTLGAAPWNLPTKTSSVLLLDEQGSVVFRYSGRMDAEDMETFFQALATLLGRDISPGAHP